jgi:hypothetical protein
MTEAGTWVGDGPEARLGGELGAWHASLPLHGTPAEVFARYAMRTREDAALDKEREERRAELRRRAEDEADAIRMGFAPEPPTHQDVLMRAAALGEIQDRREAADRQRQLQADAERAVARLTSSRAELELEQQRSSRALRSASDAHAARHEAQVEADQLRGAVYRSERFQPSPYYYR